MHTSRSNEGWLRSVKGILHGSREFKTCLTPHTHKILTHTRHAERRSDQSDSSGSLTLQTGGRRRYLLRQVAPLLPS